LKINVHIFLIFFINKCHIRCHVTTYAHSTCATSASKWQLVASRWL